MRKYILSTHVLLLFSNFLFAQVEYFVKVNPFSCNYTIIDSIPGVRWIPGDNYTFDKINRKYIFHGEDVNYNGNLYSINAVNGSVLSNPPWINYFSLMQFDNSTSTLYGIHYDTTLAINGADFVSINPTNFTYSAISHMNINGLYGDVTFDDLNHRFIFIADDSLQNHCLFCIDVTTGNIISKPIIGDNVSGIQFDNSSGNLYGLQWDNTLQVEYFVSINVANGNTIIINTIPSVNPNYNYSTFDEINKRYTFSWTNSNNSNYLYTINASNGLVISNPPFPALINPYNLIQFRYDNSTGNLYALHWGVIDEFNGIEEVYNGNSVTVSPNPSNSIFTIQLPTQQMFTLSITDITGRTIYENKNAANTITIDATGFRSGVYFVKAINEKTILSSKLIKE